jgi:pilus assembly protein Flp/PilA
MLRVLAFLQNSVTETLRRDERGATAVEYALIVALIAAAIVVTAAALGTQISNVFQNITGQF